MGLQQAPANQDLVHTPTVLGLLPRAGLAGKSWSKLEQGKEKRPQGPLFVRLKRTQGQVLHVGAARSRAALVSPRGDPPAAQTQTALVLGYPGHSTLPSSELDLVFLLFRAASLFQVPLQRPAKFCPLRPPPPTPVKLGLSNTGRLPWFYPLARGSRLRIDYNASGQADKPFLTARRGARATHQESS